MWTHLRIHHPAVFASLHKHGVLPSETPEFAPQKPRTTPIVKPRPKMSVDSTNHGHRLATASIITSGSTLISTEQPGCRAWINYITAGSYSSPCYDSVMKHVTIFADDGRDDTQSFRRELVDQGIKPVGAFDLWSSNGVGMLGSTMHGILQQKPPCQEEPWVLKCKLSGAKPCGKHRHTADNIRANYNSVLESIGVQNPVEDMFLHVLDGASNGQSAMSDRDKMWCNVHKLQCSVNVFRNHVEVKPTLSHARGTVGHFNHSTIAKNDLKKYMSECGVQPHNLTQDIEVRWSTMHDMVTDLLDCREPIALYDVRSKAPGDAYKSHKLRYDDWLILGEMKLILEPAASATSLLEGDDYVTSSLVIPSMYRVIYYADPKVDFQVPDGDGVRALPHDELNVGVQLAREDYHADLVRRYITELDFSTKRFLFIAMQCDPRFKSMHNILGLGPQLRDSARTWFLSEYAMNWQPAEQPCAGAPSEAMAEAPERAPEPRLKKSSHNKKVNLSAFLGSPSSDAAPSQAANNETDLYLALPDAPIDADPLEWWPKHQDTLPNLSLMAQQHLGVPASSASVERLFSLAGQDFCAKRQAMSETTLESLMWARAYLKDNEP